MNYWKTKRAIEVSIIGTLRDMDGNLVSREELLFLDGQVINYRPEVPRCPFEGSVEIEVFGARNLVIPYAAIMAVYERRDSVSMTHSYGRVYSPHEVEENRVIPKGEESCWTIRDTPTVRGFAVFHNGYIHQPPQNMQLEIVNHRNQVLSHEFEYPAIKPYETIKIFPSEHIASLIEFLEGEPGNANISFQIGNAFTRMLIGNETLDGNEMQVTHSNFNYARHRTDSVARSGNAFMFIPDIPGAQLQVVVYPDCAQGKYTIKHQAIDRNFANGSRLEFPVDPGSVEFSVHGGHMPSRIVTGLVGSMTNAKVSLPFEASMGVVHAEVPPKHSHWGLVSGNPNFLSRLSVVDRPFGNETMDERRFNISLYSPIYHSSLSKELSADDLNGMRSGHIFVADLFPETSDFLGEDFGYFYMTSDYGWARICTTLETSNYCMTYEHSF